MYQKSTGISRDRYLCVALQGCMHGDLDKIYKAIREIERTSNISVDLLISSGDFQAARNRSDLEDMAVPPKYRTMKDFCDYWRGEKKAPITTIFVGGNHEASGHLRDIALGGWVSPGIYYMGYSGVIRCKGVRIGGISGTFKSHDYSKGHFETRPYNETTIRSIYHVKDFEVQKLHLLGTGEGKDRIGVFVSHDWPSNVTRYGDEKQLLQIKDRNGQWASEIRNGTFGNPHTEVLLKKLKPVIWLSGHMHAKFAAIIPHTKEEIFTRFIALDKVVPRGKGKAAFLQIVVIDTETGEILPNSGFLTEIENQQPDYKASRRASLIDIEYDMEWLRILRSTLKFVPSSEHPLLISEYQLGVALEEDRESTDIIRRNLMMIHGIIQDSTIQTSIDSRELRIPKYNLCGHHRMWLIRNILGLEVDPYPLESIVHSDKESDCNVVPRDFSLSDTFAIGDLLFFDDRTAK